MKVEDIMTRDTVTVAPGETVALAARLLSRHGIGSLPVCDGGRVRGIVTDRDIVLRCVAAGLDPETAEVRDVMSRSVVTASPRDTVERAGELMAAAQVRRLPVTESGRIVGIVSLGDMARVSVCDVTASHALGAISLNLRDI